MILRIQTPPWGIHIYHYKSIVKTTTMDTAIYLDFDLCASPFSFAAEADARENGAIMRTIAATYDHKADAAGQLVDYQKVRDYYQQKLKPFITFWSGNQENEE